MQQRRHPEIVELDLGEADLLAQRHREDADVHRVGEGVLVVVAQRGQADQRGLVVEHLVDDRLHRALDLLHAGGAAHADRVDDVLGDGDTERWYVRFGDFAGLLSFGDQLLGLE